MQDFTIYPLGEGALTISFGNVIEESTSRRVLQLFHRLQNGFPFITDLVPAYSSLTIYYDVFALYTDSRTAFERIRQILLPLLAEPQSEHFALGRRVALPVCYAEDFAPDLAELAFRKKMSVKEVILLHTSTLYRVYMIGFLPGFPYMGTVDSRIAMGRKSSPRESVAAGSVGIAGAQTGIYPLQSPGGWNIIGRTPLSLFDKDSNEPVLLQPGDTVTFYSITEDEFASY